MDYRKDIDGLRAVAVLPVVFYHAGFNAVQGGFLGVDVFFVISGFLITKILLNELENDSFSLITFYERRARRILPALFAMLFLTTIMAYIFLLPSEFRGYSQSLVSVVAFMSNVYFYLNIDYFSISAAQMPLLHTWSLAIEEQYYLFFPLLLLWIWKKCKQFILPSFLIIFIFSLSYMLWLNHESKISASFYWIFPRAWELMAGSVCAYWSRDRNDKGFLANIGLTILLVSIFTWSKDIPHPSVYTIIPVVGTCLILLYSHNTCAAYKILSNRLFVAIGLISYSLYLWHQPIFAFMSIKSNLIHYDVQTPLGLFLTFLLAYLSYKFIETPLRNKNKFNKQFIFSMSTIFLALFGLGGLYSHLNQGVPSRFKDVVLYTDSITSSPKRNLCHSYNTNYIKPEDACTFISDDVSWASFGDSHTVEMSYALANELEKHDIGIRQHSYTDCPPSLNYKTNGNELCSQWINETLSFLEADNSISHVLLGFRYSYGIYGDNVQSYPLIPTNVTLNIQSEAVLSDEEKLLIYWESLEEIIKRLLDSNKTIILLGPIPELPVHIEKITFPNSIFQNTLMFPNLNLITTRDYYDRRHLFILERMRGLSFSENLLFIPVYDLLCKYEGCPAVIEGSALYFDDDHLSLGGAKILIDRFLESNPDLLSSPTLR
jgi:peptidoglycan/LPS O-acetylase OafA/YrhL